MYQLARTLHGHNGDVKGVAFAQKGLVSVARDGSTLLEGTTQLYSGPEYLNAVAVGVLYDSREYVFIGSKDSTITSICLDAPHEPHAFFLGHESNVCALDVESSILASGSWDTTARVWNVHEPQKAQYVLKGHSQAVWGVKILDQHRILTASADKTIRLWQDGKCTKVYKGHTDAVRSLCVLENNTFASASNDTTIRVWDLDTGTCLHLLEGHTSFVYSLAYDQYTGNLFSSGEDRTLRIWQHNQCIQAITLPCVSLWSLAVSNGLVAVGSSDHKVRVFSAKEAEYAPIEEREELADAVAHSAIGQDQTGTISENQLSDKAVLQTQGRPGQVVMIKERGSIEAYQYSLGTWQKVGTVLQGSSSDGARVKYNGKEYDYVFDVDIRDNAPPLKLPFNNSDNLNDRAQSFIAENGLPPDYEDQIVRFLIANTEATRVDSGSKPQARSVAPEIGSEERPVPQILRYSQPQMLVSFNKQALMRTFISTANKYSYQPDATIDLVEKLPLGADELLKISLELLPKWEISDKLVLLDLLRLSIAYASTVPLAVVSVQLLSCLEQAYPKHALLSVRGLVNLAGRENGRDIVERNRQIFAQALDMLQTIETVSTPFAVALATLTLNLAVCDYAGELAPFALFVSRHATDPEVAYRLALAIGVRGLRVKGERQLLSESRPFFDANNEPRFKEVAQACQQLLN